MEVKHGVPDLELDQFKIVNECIKTIIDLQIYTNNLFNDLTTKKLNEYNSRLFNIKYTVIYNFKKVCNSEIDINYNQILENLNLIGVNESDINYYINKIILATNEIILISFLNHVMIVKERLLLLDNLIFNFTQLIDWQTVVECTYKHPFIKVAHESEEKFQLLKTNLEKLYPDIGKKDIRKIILDTLFKSSFDFPPPIGTFFLKITNYFIKKFENIVIKIDVVKYVAPEITTVSEHKDIATDVSRDDAITRWKEFDKASQKELDDTLKDHSVTTSPSFVNYDANAKDDTIGLESKDFVDFVKNLDLDFKLETDLKSETDLKPETDLKSVTDDTDEIESEIEAELEKDALYMDQKVSDIEPNVLDMEQKVTTDLKDNTLKTVMDVIAQNKLSKNKYLKDYIKYNKKFIKYFIKYVNIL
jgi:hypothetical protein